MTAGEKFPIIVRGVASLVATLCAFVDTSADTGATGRFVVAIRLRVDRSIATRRIPDRLKTETEAIWKMYGIRFAWSDRNGGAPPANGLSLDVSVERQPERRKRLEWPAVLGHVVIKPPLPAWRPIHVSLDATERVLADRTNERPSSGIVLDRELARALGRVLAHEVGHVLLDVSDHDRVGLMRATFRGDILADADRRPFRLTCSGVDRLGKRLPELTGDPQEAVQLSSRRLTADAASESPEGPSCIRTQPAQ